MSSVARLVLGSYPHSYGLDLPRVIDVLGDFETGPLQNIQILGLKGVSTHGDSLCQTKLKEKAGTAPFTKLKLRCFLQTPRSLEALVRWPKHLETFELKFSFGDNYAKLGLYTEWTLAVLKQILAIHRRALCSIKVYAVDISGLAGFDLRDFESLEELSLSFAHTGHQYPVKDYMIGPFTNLLAPRLRVFHWDLTLQDQQNCEGLNDFGQEEEDWLRAQKAVLDVPSPWAWDVIPRHHRVLRMTLFDYSDDSQCLALMMKDGSVNIYDISDSPLLLSTFSLPAQEQSPESKAEHSVYYAPNSRSGIFFTAGHGVGLWDMDTSTVEEVPREMKFDPVAAFSSDSRTVDLFICFPPTAREWPSGTRLGSLS